MGWRRFVLFDAARRVALVRRVHDHGYVFSGELERIAGRAAYLGEWLLVLILRGFRRRFSISRSRN